jgi:hypothetical protein
VWQLDKNVTAIDVSASGGRIAVAYGKTKAEGEIKIMGLSRRTRSHVAKLILQLASDGSQVVGLKAHSRSPPRLV